MLKLVAPILFAIGFSACVDDDKDPIPPDDDDGETQMGNDPDQVDPDTIAEPGEEGEEPVEDPTVDICNQARAGGKGDIPCTPHL